MGKINWKLVNLAFWIELALSYVLPFRVTEGLQVQVGFPMPFLSIGGMELGVNPLMSMGLNPLGLALDILVIYYLFDRFVAAYQKRRDKRVK